MKRDSIFRITLLAVVLSVLVPAAYCDVGDTFICKWKDNKRGAFAMTFDGDYISAMKAAFPKIIQRDLPATLYFNPGLSRYAAGIDFWETAPNRYGWDTGHHQMECRENMWDWGDMNDAHYQVGEAARTVWSLRPPGATKLHGMFIWPGGSSGGLTAEQWTELTTTYYLLSGCGGGGGGTPNASWTYDQLIAQPQYAYDNNTDRGLLFHQIGQYGEYEYVVNEDYFEDYLDWLVAKRDVLWITGSLALCLYKQEYASANVTVTATSPEIRLSLTSSKDAALYTQPLTLITQVPSTWTYCRVSQGTISAKKTYPVNVWTSSATVMYEAVPGWGQVSLENSANLDASAPSAVAVSDGLSSDIDTTGELHELSANWSASADAETGIKKYWYKIGTSAAGSELMDWIDNGTYTYVTVTRTHLSLVRGTTYYFTVKAENGQGLQGPAASSDGQCVEYAPGYIKFSDGFESGNTYDWDSATGMTVTANSPRAGLYCVTAPLASAGKYLTKGNFNTAGDLYLSFYFKLGPNFSMQNGRINIGMITAQDGGIVAMIFINYYQGLYLLNCEFVTDNNDWPSIPDGVTPYSPGVLQHIGANTWHRVDLHTKADALRKGGAELWVDGVKAASFLEKYTATKAARNVMIGAVSVSSTSVGDIYFDEIILSDSLMKNYVQVSTSADTTPPSDIAAVNDGTGADIDSTSSAADLSANWSAAVDGESGIANYKYAIGTSPGGTDVADWTTLGNVTSVTRTGLNLTNGIRYYFSVKALNGVGMESVNTTNSDGQYVPGGGTALADVYPNPYNLASSIPMEFRLSANAGGEVKIYTLSGKLVKKLSGTSGTIDWDGTNEDGEKVARGIYLYQTTDGSGNKTTGKIAVIR